MKQYAVTGMSCAACSARVEKAVSAVEGVTECSVNLLTNSMGVEGTASDEVVIAAVVNAGYGAKRKGSGSLTADRSDHKDESEPTDQQSSSLLRRLLVSVGFLCVLMYLSMGHMMFGWPLPSFMDGNHVMMGLSQLLLAAIIMVINQRFFISGSRGLIHRAPNMDTLVAIGSAAAFIYSTWTLFAMVDAQYHGDTATVEALMHDLYFESAAMILTLITVGKLLEAKAKGKTTSAIKSLMRLAPKTAIVLVDGKETAVPVAQVKPGDVFVLRPGFRVPVDGHVIEGVSAADESALTGESIPVDKSVGDTVSAATTNLSGYLKCEATRVGEDTTLAQIIRMVSDAAATKAPIAKIADKVAGVFVPAVICIAIVTFIIWMICGATVGTALTRAVAVLVISCPCALGLATPVAIMVGSGVGAKNGILFKTAVSLETAGKVSIVALDKTGTITEGNPVVTDVVPADGMPAVVLLSLAAALEQGSEHPLAKAVVQEAVRRGITAEKAFGFQALPGNGVKAKLDDADLFGGSVKYIETITAIPTSFRAKIDELSQNGKTLLLFVRNGELLGMIAVADVMKADSARAVKELQVLGLQVVMLTGDNARTAAAIGKQAGVDQVISDVLPDGKSDAIRALQQNGKVAMVGDGINDAPALTQADVGIAIGAGSDVAVDAADIVLVNSSLRDVAASIRLSRAVLRNIKENLFWAFCYNIVGIPLASGAFISLFGWSLSPMFGAAAMSLSSFLVVTNALRLNLFDPKKQKHQ